MPLSPDKLRPQLAEVLAGQLEVHEVLGAGAFAAVFRARDPFLERDVAVKVLDPNLAPSEELQEQFLREARIVASVEHPHIVPLYAAEARGGLLYMVMRLMPGRTLGHRLESGTKLEPGEAARLAHEIAQALVAAHEHGVVHRDLKPGNVLLDGSGHAFVSDFGISRVTAHVEDQATGIIVGTPGYMSPEQIAGASLDGRSDVYALGVVLFEMLVGRPPFLAANTQELLFRHLNERPPDIERLDRHVPIALARLARNCLAKDPDSRPPASEVARALVVARSPEALVPPRVTRWRRVRRPLTILAAVLTPLVVVFLGGRVVWNFLAGLIISGEPPNLEASGASIPPAVIDSLRRRGALGAGDTARYVFAPSAGRNGELFAISDSAVTWSTTTDVRRFRKSGIELEVGRESGDKPGEKYGYLIITESGRSPDTLARNLSGLEVVRLLTMIASRSKATAERAP